MKKALVVLALAVVFAVPAVAQTKPRVYIEPPKNVLPLSKDFAKAGLKAILAVHDFNGGEVETSRVKGLVEDAQVAVTTEGDSAMMKSVAQYVDSHELAREMARDFKEHEDACDADRSASYEQCQALKTQDSSRIKDIEYRAEQSFDAAVKQLKDQKYCKFTDCRL
jgi:hypothetical protein